MWWHTSDRRSKPHLGTDDITLCQRSSCFLFSLAVHFATCCHIVDCEHYRNCSYLAEARKSLVAVSILRVGLTGVLTKNCSTTSTQYWTHIYYHSKHCTIINGKEWSILVKNKQNVNEGSQGCQRQFWATALHVIRAAWIHLSGKLLRRPFSDLQT